MIVPAIPAIVTERPCQGLQQEGTADGVRGRNHHLVCLGANVAPHGRAVVTYVCLSDYTNTYAIVYMIYV